MSKRNIYDLTADDNLTAQDSFHSTPQSSSKMIPVKKERPIPPRTSSVNGLLAVVNSICANKELLQILKDKIAQEDLKDNGRKRKRVQDYDSSDSESLESQGNANKYYLDQNKLPFSKEKVFYLIVNASMIKFDANSSLDDKERNLLVLKKWKTANIKWRDAKSLSAYNFKEFLFLKDIKDSEGQTLMERVESYLFANPYKAIGKLYIVFPRDIPVLKKEYEQAAYFERMYSILGWRKFWHVIYEKKGSYITGFSPVKVFAENNLFAKEDKPCWLVLPHFRFKIPNIIYNWHYLKNTVTKAMFPKLYWSYDNYHTAKRCYKSIVKAHNEENKHKKEEDRVMLYPEAVRIAMQ